MNKDIIIPDSDPSSAEDECMPTEIIDKANKIRNNLLPDKSKEKYEKAYKNFMEWRSIKKIKSFTEPVLLTYFDELSQHHAPSSLWATYSMLRNVIDTRHNINIHDYSNLITFLKKKKKGFISKKSSVLNTDDIAKFIDNATNDQYLGMKVALIFGVMGACRRQELCDITIDDVIDKGDMAVVNIPRTKNNKPRTFVIMGEFYKIYKKYADLRPKDATTKRFFLTYREGKCNGQVIGINTFGGMPKTVAKYLKLPNAESYTGHSFRRTSATVLANTGADMLELKRHGGWTSNSVVEGYIEDFLKNKENTSRKIMTSILNVNKPSTSTAQEPQDRLENVADFTNEHSEDSSENNNSKEYNLKRIINEEEQQEENKIVKKIKLDDGKTINLHFSNCSNINIYFGSSTKD